MSNIFRRYLRYYLPTQIIKECVKGINFLLQIFSVLSLVNNIIILRFTLQQLIYLLRIAFSQEVP